MTLHLPYRHQPPARDPDACGHEDFHGACGACQRRRVALHREADERGRLNAALWYATAGRRLEERNARYRETQQWDA